MNFCVNLSVDAHVHRLADLVWRHLENGVDVPRQKTVSTLAELLETDPSLDGHAISNIMIHDLGLVLPRTVSLIESANQRLRHRAPVDVNPIRQGVRNHKLMYVDSMVQLVATTKHLTQVLDADWFDGVRDVIRQWDASSVFSIPTHPAFMGYYDDAAVAGSGTNLITEIDLAFDLILPYARKLTTKLHQIGSSTPNYAPAVFEALVLGGFARSQSLRDYEPKLPAGGKGEARIELAGEQLLVEARSKMDEHRGGGGAFDPHDMGEKLFSKLQKKYSSQYRGIAEPLLIFFSLEAGVIQDIEPEAAIVRILSDPTSRNLSAVVFSDTYRARRMWLWRNSAATYPLSAAAGSALANIFGLDVFRPTGLV